MVPDSVALLIELERLVVPERSITRPVRESYALPELSMILVLELVDALLPVTLLRVPLVAVLPETEPRALVVVLPDKALRVPDAEDDLPESRAALLLLLAELDLYRPVLLPERLWLRLL